MPTSRARQGHPDRLRRFRDRFRWQHLRVLVALDKQSPDIKQGVDAKKAEGKATAEQGAGDQGMMFGFACDETRELMPTPIMLAHRLTRGLAKARRSGKLPFVRPDGKSQVSVVYDGFRPIRVDTVVVSTQHDPDVSHKQLSAAIIDEIIKKEIPAKLLDKKTRFLVNPTGRFVTGGPQGGLRCPPAARSSWILTAGWGGTAAARFSGKDLQGGPQRSLYGALCRQEHRRGQAGPPV
jgi:S-adenosylmethionine synthetase